MPFSKRPETETSHNSPSGEQLYGLLFHNGLDGLMLTATDGSVLEAKSRRLSNLRPHSR